MNRAFERNADLTTEQESSDAAERPSLVREQLHLVHSSPDQAVGVVVELDQRQAVVIGRGANADINLADPRVSRAHVRIVWDSRARSYRVSDLGSANGTYVNGRCVETGLLSRHDVLRAGDSLFVCDSRREVDQLQRDGVLAAKSSLPILLLGETGSGKEVLARQLHHAGGRSGKFVPLNCATLPKDLAAAELFGHTRAAFSGASEARAGLFRAAQCGTLFLDEIGDLPAELQSTLLRTLQESTIRPVGADREIEVDVRIIAATHADLEELVQSGAFREDLLARLQQLVLTLLPLRQRRSEILSLAATFAPKLEISADAAEALLLWHWPRNVRELRAGIETFLTLEPEARVLGATELARRLPQAAQSLRKAQPGAEHLKAEPKGRSDLAELLKKHSGNVAAVAREMKKPRSHVYRWMRNFGLHRSNGER